MDFCECGSIVIRGSCTNQKCSKHVNHVGLATYKQIEFIKSLSNDDDEINFDILTKKEASKLIDKLLERQEMGE